VLFKADVWDGLADGSVTVAFRRWKRPTVKAGGTLQSPGGLLAIDAVEPVEEGSIGPRDARAAGFADADAVLAALGPPVAERTLYRVRFHRIGDDPRVVLRQEPAGDDVGAALDRLDAASDDGPWTRQVLALIAEHPGRRAPDLAGMVGQETSRFKRRVRRLKALGLTESLEVGYRVTPRYESLAHPARLG
jgi:hypothetical protein